MRNFSEFIKDYESAKNKKTENEQKSKFSKEDLSQKITQDYQKYSSYSQSELLDELVKEADKQKKEGTFDYQKLKNAVDMFSGYITEEQKERIQSFLLKIK